MSNDVLKAYAKRTSFDDWYEIMDYDPELGFNPRFWISRTGETRSIMENKIVQTLVTDELLRGQAFGL
jgi:hypothetical protein